MDSTSLRPQRGYPMSRYIAVALLAVAAAAITATDLAVTLDQSDSARNTSMVRP
jgi:hypothetical protein